MLHCKHIDKLGKKENRTSIKIYRKHKRKRLKKKDRRQKPKRKRYRKGRREKEGKLNNDWWLEYSGVQRITEYERGEGVIKDKITLKQKLKSRCSETEKLVNTRDLGMTNNNNVKPQKAN